MKLYRDCFKRVIDVVVSGCALLCLSPLLAVVTIWLHFANKGAGAFFLQERHSKVASLRPLVHLVSYHIAMQVFVTNKNVNLHQNLVGG